MRGVLLSSCGWSAPFPFPFPFPNPTAGLIIRIIPLPFPPPTPPPVRVLQHRSQRLSTTRSSSGPANSFSSDNKNNKMGSIHKDNEKEKKTQLPPPPPTTKTLEPPEKPLPGDCCGSGCVRCVWDVYYEELEAYNNSLSNSNSSPPSNQ